MSLKNFTKAWLLFLFILVLMLNIRGQNVSAEVSNNERSVQSQQIQLEDKDQEIQLLKSQISLFEATINELPLCTPESAAELWIKGVKQRNGVMQYAALSKELKRQFRRNIGSELWVTGVSSPWMTDYKIVKKQKISSGLYKLFIQSNWATSTGPAGTFKNAVVVGKEGTSWRVQEIKQNKSE